MRGLTVRQPWATAIVRMGKDVENRSRNIAGGYRGPVAIHAGLAPTGRRGSTVRFDSVGEVERDAGGMLLRSPRLGWPYRLPVGLIIGVVDLVGVHASKRSRTVAHEGKPVCFDDETPIGRLCSEWALPDLHHLTLANPRVLSRPIPYVGRLGLWTVSDDVERQIKEQLS